MQRLEIDGLTFDFPDDWRVGRYDDWRFYRNHFGKMWPGIKALDALAVETESSRTAWLIEVKDDRSHDRTKPSALSGEVARKLFDTLSAILPAKLNAAEANESRKEEALLPRSETVKGLWSSFRSGLLGSPTGRETPAARPGYADFSRHPGRRTSVRRAGALGRLKSPVPGVPDESGVPKRSRAATWTLPMWPKR